MPVETLSVVQLEPLCRIRFRARLRCRGTAFIHDLTGGLNGANEPYRLARVVRQRVELAGETACRFIVTVAVQRAGRLPPVREPRLPRAGSADLGGPLLATHGRPY
jgi:hypothetical protein